MPRLTAALTAFCLVLSSAALGLALGTAIGFFRLKAGEGKFRGLQSLEASVLVGGVPAAAVGGLLGLYSYLRHRRSDEQLSRRIVCRLTSLLGFAVGTVCLAPLVLSIDPVDRIACGMLFGGIPLAFCGHCFGRDRYRYVPSPAASDDPHASG